ncbi:MAG: penicillin-binding protein 2 [Candidatus Falkowbacteria bacterium]
MHAPSRRKAKTSSFTLRARFLLALVFILGGTIIGQLFRLQIINHQQYVDSATFQQQGYAQVTPDRGRIFIQDSAGSEDDSELFPLATNKQYALVYARPSEVTYPSGLAEKIYALINQADEQRIIQAKISASPEYASTTAEIKKLKIEAELKKIHDEKVGDYVARLARKDDPYEPIAKKVEISVAEELKKSGFIGIDFSLEQDRFYPEKNIAAHVLGFVGYVGDEKRGRYGLEGYFEDELGGKSGKVFADRNGTGDLMINQNTPSAVTEGSDLILTINRSIQFESCRLLAKSVAEHGAEGGSVIIMDPITGAIIAMCAFPDFDPNDFRSAPDMNVFNNPVIFDQFEPGSTFKAITMAAAIDQGKVSPNTTYEDKGSIMIEGWPKPIKNSDAESFGGHGKTTMTKVIELSLNTGSIFAMQSIGAPTFVQYVKKFGFGVSTGIELETEGRGDIANLSSKKIRPINAATASFGQGMTATPIQMVNSYAVIANGGILMKPYIVKAIVARDNQQIITQPKQLNRVISQKTASLMTAMMVNAVENGHAKRAKVPGFYVAGKTGTAQVAAAGGKGYEEGKTIQTFIGYAPASKPKFVMLTRLDNPKDRFAESSAVPLFGEIAAFMLNYYQSPLERANEVKK